MQKHTSIYLKFFDYGEPQDIFIPFKQCSGRSVNIHHLDGRGKNMDFIENLMALCRFHHDKAYDYPEFNEALKEVHVAFIMQQKPDYKIQTS